VASTITLSEENSRLQLGLGENCVQGIELKELGSRDSGVLLGVSLLAPLVLRVRDIPVSHSPFRVDALFGHQALKVVANAFTSRTPESLLPSSLTSDLGRLSPQGPLCSALLASYMFNTASLIFNSQK